MKNKLLAGWIGFVLFIALTVNAFALDTPTLTTTTSGLNLSLSWSSVSGANGYTLHYTPDPYTPGQTIYSADMGTAMTFSATLWGGAAYYVAISSYDGTSESGYSNIGLFTIDVNIPLSTGRDTTTPVVEVTSRTGRVWMDRNLGASQVATSPTDEAAYGDLYQWGRGADGHEKRSSQTTSSLSTSDSSGHGNFITSGLSHNYDWRDPQNDNLWQGELGTNNPCPSGFRLPTATELETELNSWSSDDSDGAFASPLKLVAAGYRHRSSGTLGSEGFSGDYWCSTAYGSDAKDMYFGSGGASTYFSSGRAVGLSVRCLKD